MEEERGETSISRGSEGVETELKSKLVSLSWTGVPKYITKLV